MLGLGLIRVCLVFFIVWTIVFRGAIIGLAFRLVSAFVMLFRESCLTFFIVWTSLEAISFINIFRVARCIRLRSLSFSAKINT